MVSDESIKEIVKECLEGEFSEVFKALFREIGKMQRERAEEIIKTNED